MVHISLSITVIPASSRMAMEAPLKIFDLFSSLKSKNLPYSSNNQCAQTYHSNVPLPGTKATLIKETVGAGLQFQKHCCHYGVEHCAGRQAGGYAWYWMDIDIPNMS